MNLRRTIGSGAVLTAIAVGPVAAARSDVADAAMHGNATAVRSLIQQKADVNLPQADGSTALHWAAYRRDHATAELLIRAGGKVTVTTREGVTPLSLASANGDATMIATLLKAGADPNERSRTGNTPLMIASRTGDPAAMQVLLDHGADVNAKENLRGTTALMWAAAEADPAAVRLLIRNGADLHARSSPALRERSDTIPKGNAPEEGAIVNGKVLDSGYRRPVGTGNIKHFEPNGGGLTPLVFAVRRNDLEVVRVLVEAGADVNQVTDYGWSPLLVATHNRYYQLGSYLLDHGADPTIANTGKWTPLYLAVDNRNIEAGDYPVRKPDMDHLELIRKLIDKGADVNARAGDNTDVFTVFVQQWLNEDGATPFLRAAQSSDLEVMKLLLAHGADPKIATKVGVTALQVAAGIGWVEGITHEWSEQANVETVKLLLDLDLDPNAVAETGRTALHGAATKGRTAIIQLLVDHGARLDVRDYGMTGPADRSGRLEFHTWQPLDYADGLVKLGAQNAIPRPEAASLLRKLMTERGLFVPPPGRTLDMVCRAPEVCVNVKD